MSSKKKRKRSQPTLEPAKATTTRSSLWQKYLPAGLLALLLVVVYWPATKGPFLFDDLYQPFYQESPEKVQLTQLLHTNRPVLMLTYWINLRLSGLDPFPFHVINLLLHMFNCFLIFQVTRRIALYFYSDKDSAFVGLTASVVFALHPVQTEAVSYISSRSETLSVFFFLLAYWHYLRWRETGLTWKQAGTVVLLYAAAVLSKEHAAVFPILVILTELSLSKLNEFKERMLAQARFFLLLLPGILVAAFRIIRTLQTSDSAGFNYAEVKWYEYLFTQFRAIWVYLRMYVLPTNLSVDHVFPISRTIFEHGAIWAALGLAVLLGLAFKIRPRYPLIAFGSFVFLLLLAPTSSIIPIADPLADRRLYLPSIGLVLATGELVVRMIASPGSRYLLIVCLGAVLAATCYARNQVWSDPLKLWLDAIEKHPENARAYFHLAFEYYQRGECQQAVSLYNRAEQLGYSDARLFVNRALALDCLGRFAEAVADVKRAIQIQPSAHGYSQLGMLYAKYGDLARAEEAFLKGLQINPDYDLTYAYLGQLKLEQGMREQAKSYYQKALELNPDNEIARRGMEVLEDSQPK